MEQDGLSGGLQKISSLEALEASNQGRAGDAPSPPSYTWDRHKVCFCCNVRRCEGLVLVLGMLCL